MVTVISYGVGNIGSILNMLKRIGVKACVASTAVEVEAADKIILPGVGSFDTAMAKIRELDLVDVLNYKALDQKIPLLGICLGMQLLTNGSEEGEAKGFGWIDADTVKFRFSSNETLKIPHMGWNSVHLCNKSQLTVDLPDDTRFYFVHSYYVRVHDENCSIMKTRHGIEFDSAIQNDNIFGAQFHPEKSHKFGMSLLKNFTKL